MKFDVIVAGSGSAGMTAAIVSAKLGLDVLLVEKTEYFGGTSAFSGGGCWIPCNPLMGRVGLSDTREAAETYIKQVVGNYLRPDIMESFLDNGPKMVSFLDENTEIEFQARTPFPDYFTELEGSMVGGRSLGSVTYDGRKLGPWFDKLRPPLNTFNAPMGMMFAPPDLMHALKASKSWTSFKYMAALGLRFLKDRLTYKRGTRLTMGNAMMGRFLRSAIDAGITLWSESPCQRLIFEDGRVVGMVVTHEGKDVEVRARRGVVLATGGFSANAEMRKEYLPSTDQNMTIVSPGNTGDGLSMALTSGAVMDQPNLRNAIWAVVSLLKNGDGSVTKAPHFFLDLPKPGCIAVNREGKRFGDEANLELAVAMLETNSIPAYLICDAPFIKKNGFGQVWPGGLRLGEMLRRGYVIKGRTISELATKLGIDADGLVATVARNNEFAKTGKDLDFHRGDSDLDRSFGDPTQKPNPTLGPIGTAPFYAIEIWPADNSSLAGIRVDGKARALDANDKPIPGLYVCGLDMKSLWAGATPCNGAYHGLNMTFGYVIANELAKSEPAAL
jgi:succinate dehydrogenase/fumarate reductase flavoprotein subunit